MAKHLLMLCWTFGNEGQPQLMLLHRTFSSCCCWPWSCVLDSWFLIFLVDPNFFGHFEQTKKNLPLWSPTIMCFSRSSLVAKVFVQSKMHFRPFKQGSGFAKSVFFSTFDIILPCLLFTCFLLLFLF